MKRKISIPFSMVLIIIMLLSSVSLALVSTPVKSLSIENPVLYMSVGDTFNLKPIVSPLNATGKVFAWKTSSSDVVSVDKKGRIKALKQGKAEITVKLVGGNLAAACSVTVDKKEKITMYASSYGFQKPDSVDIKNNDYVRMIETYANVDLTLTIPPWSDDEQRFTLLLASGKLPDIVNTGRLAPAVEAAKKGAFIDLKKYYDKSADFFKKMITPKHMERAIADNGRYYRVPMAWNGGPPAGVRDIVRYDLLKKYNNGKFPESVNEWVDVLRTIKKANPKWTLITSYAQPTAFWYYNRTLFHWYGVEPHAYSVINGKVESDFTQPGYRAAVLLLKQMYEEGILDKEFATQTVDQMVPKTLDCMFQVRDVDMTLYLVQKGLTDPAYKNMVWEPLLPLKKSPPELKDIKYTYANDSDIIIGIGTYISKNCKNPARAWRVIEAFAQDRLQDRFIWGKEGEGYKISNGKRIPDFVKLKEPLQFWSGQFALVFGFANEWKARLAYVESVYSEPDYKLFTDSMATGKKQAETRGVSFISKMPNIENVVKKLPESDILILEATTKAIMGRITMEEFDKKVGEYKTKYGFIAEQYTEELKKNKDKWISQDANEAGW